MNNIMTFDIEDWYHPSLVNRDSSQWHHCEDRIIAPTMKILEILFRTGNRATFFILGYIAERFPDMVLKIKKGGHEIASHGYGHQVVNRMNRKEFTDDFLRSKNIIEEIINEKIIGYRAPSWSINEETPWVWRILHENGILYDSSKYPFKTFLYGSHSNPRFFHKIEVEPDRHIWEVPPSVITFLGIRIPFCGGFYFRILPYGFIKFAIHRINRKEKQSVLLYLHPWELDPEQPRVSSGFRNRFVQYYNLTRTEKKLDRVLNAFHFTSIRQYLTDMGAS